MKTVMLHFSARGVFSFLEGVVLEVTAGGFRMISTVVLKSGRMWRRMKSR